MKRLTCDMGGRTDPVKRDGAFVCQGRGCKDSVEEAAVVSAPAANEKPDKPLTLARRDAYWQEHPEEKMELEARLRALEDERETLRGSRDELQARISPLLRVPFDQRVPAETKRDQTYQQIRQLQTRHDGLGLFKRKEKKALQAEINRLLALIPTINRHIEAQKEDQKQQLLAVGVPVQQELTACQKRLAAIDREIGEINEELNRDR